MDVKKIVSQSKFAQVGFVVNDIEKAKKQFALLFGCEIPPTCDCGTFDVTQTQIYGKPAPDAACVMAFFDMTPGVQLELIQPNEEPSVWRDYLNTYGEGIHHIAFQVDDADEVANVCRRRWVLPLSRRAITVMEAENIFIYSAKKR